MERQREQEKVKKKIWRQSPQKNRIVEDIFTECEEQVEICLVVPLNTNSAHRSHTQVHSLFFTMYQVDKQKGPARDPRQGPRPHLQGKVNNKSGPERKRES